ncbi:MAG: hypothetical protein HY895_01770 [Deltaproteobacteria bacterium]|nr:hypothetical protein [Deltaproteobacteria bacterium]
MSRQEKRFDYGEDCKRHMNEIAKTIERMDPESALKEVGQALKTIFPSVSEESRGEFLLELVGESQADKVSSLVHL